MGCEWTDPNAGFHTECGNAVRLPGSKRESGDKALARRREELDQAQPDPGSTRALACSDRRLAGRREHPCGASQFLSRYCGHCSEGTTENEAAISMPGTRGQSSSPEGTG